MAGRMPPEQRRDVLDRYRDDLTRFAVPELLWDLGCDVPDWVRAHILAEFGRRGLDPVAAARTHGRGLRRG